MTKYFKGDGGYHIKGVQRDLQTVGYPLPKYGVDGDMGNETLGALGMYAVDINFDLGPDEELSADDDLVGLVGQLAKCAEGERGHAPMLEIPLRDVTGRYTKVIKGVRQWSKIDAIVLHQTGTTHLPDDPKRWVHIPAHIGIPKHVAEVYLMHPLDSYLYHANSLNRRSIGFEISGNFEGIEGKPHTHWKAGGGPDNLTETQIEATRAGIIWVCDQAKFHGGEITHIFAHRQASKDRVGDPGSRSWQMLGEWARDELGLNDGGAGFKVGSGRPLPEEWSTQDSYKGYAYL